MKFLFLILLLFISKNAGAEVPYSSLNEMRVKSVVVRVASDNPQQPWIKKCVSVDRAISAGSKLALAMENAESGWRKMEITATDIGQLKKRIAICERRGSCQVYDAFLNSAQANKALTEEILNMKDLLSKKMSSLTAKDFAAPFKEIQNPCGILKALTK